MVGIIGRNGAGKSTLLKILSRITEPTEGEADIHGRVGSLLEVGTGFHPELTGRENVYLNGAILGMRRAEIARKFDEIVAFAEVEKFIDTPVKHYSSGMYMRLAFAVAAHLEPEILIVDEVLAVGDAEFQKKCLGKMGDVARGGRTVLFVSHNMATVANLCTRVVWLERGAVREDGAARPVVARYTNDSTKSAADAIDLTDLPAAGRWAAGSGWSGWSGPRPRRWCTAARSGSGSRVRAASAVEDISLGIGFNMPDGSRFLTFESDAGLPGETIPAGAERVYELTVPEFPVSPGVYSVDVGIRSGDRYLADGLSRVTDVDVTGAEDTPTHILQFENVGVRLTGEWNRGG